jgi:hypothetical protein
MAGGPTSGSAVSLMYDMPGDRCRSERASCRRHRRQPALPMVLTRNATTVIPFNAGDCQALGRRELRRAASSRPRSVGARRPALDKPWVYR